MNQEQNMPDKAEQNKALETDKDKAADDYYSVDDPKKDFSTTIGDGEMHNEGLVGDGSVDDNGSFSEGSTGAQEEAENHDSEG